MDIPKQETPEEIQALAERILEAEKRSSGRNLSVLGQTDQFYVLEKIMIDSWQLHIDPQRWTKLTGRPLSRGKLY